MFIYGVSITVSLQQNVPLDGANDEWQLFQRSVELSKAIFLHFTNRSYCSISVIKAKKLGVINTLYIIDYCYKNWLCYTNYTKYFKIKE